MARPGYNSNRIYNQTDTAMAGRSVFDLSYRKLTTMDFGQLIPVMAEEAVPGDVWTINQQLLIRMQPLVAPIMHEVNAYVHSFFVPYRLLWPKPDYVNDPPVLESGSWERFITGGKNGDDDSVQPVWPTGTYSSKTLWDYFGFPTGIAVPAGSTPNAYQLRAYNLVYNDYYRDENLIDPIDLDDTAIKYRAWEKDYFTSALVSQQRGTAPALPVSISGDSSAIFDFDPYLLPVKVSNSGNDYNLVSDKLSSGSTTLTMKADGAPSTTWSNAPTGALLSAGPGGIADNHVPGDSFTATTFDVADLRLAFQIQRFMERNNRAGVRYTEFLGAHFNVSPSDARLQRPEYIGGIRTPVIISEVLQTSQTGTTAQGNMAGHGITVDQSFVGKYRVEEFGVIISIMSIMPRSMYTQGINRQWLRRTRYDYYFPEFAHLSEQGIENMELYLGTNNSTNQTIWGYQGRYDEMRTKQSMATAEFRTPFGYWHLARNFASLPSLNGNFVTLTAAENGATYLKRIFADTTDNGFLVSVGNIVKAVRPLPAIPIPGMIDHG